MSSKREPIDLDLFRPTGAVPPGAEGPPPPAPAPAPAAPPVPEDHWHWSGHDMARTHRYPVELLEALESRTFSLKLPVGLTVAAAIASLLDLDDDELEAAVRRAQAARPGRSGRR